MQHLGDVIFVEIVSHTVGSSPSITCLHTPPITMADVR